MKEAENAIIDVQNELSNIANELRSIAYDLRTTQTGIAEANYATTIEKRAAYYEKKRNSLNNIKIKKKG